MTVDMKQYPHKWTQCYDLHRRSRQTFLIEWIEWLEDLDPRDNCRERRQHLLSFEGNEKHNKDRSCV